MNSLFQQFPALNGTNSKYCLTPLMETESSDAYLIVSEKIHMINANISDEEGDF